MPTGGCRADDRFGCGLNLQHVVALRCDVSTGLVSGAVGFSVGSLAEVLQVMENNTLVLLYLNWRFVAP